MAIRLDALQQKLTQFLLQVGDPILGELHPANQTTPDWPDIREAAGDRPTSCPTPQS